MGTMTWIYCLTVLAHAAFSKEKTPTGFVMLHESTQDESKDPIPYGRTTEPMPSSVDASTSSRTTQIETISTLQNPTKNNSTNAKYTTETTDLQNLTDFPTEYGMLTETATTQKSSTEGLSQEAGVKKPKLYQVHFSFGGGKLQIKINNTTKSNNSAIKVIEFPYRKSNRTFPEDKSDKNPDSERRIAKKIISPNGPEIKICIGKLSKTNYCNSIGKCEHYANWLGEIIGTMNSTEALNLYIQMDSTIWQELVKKNNSCENLNHKRAFVQIIFTKSRKEDQIKSGKDVNIFYGETINKKDSIKRVDLFQSLCLPAEECLKLWIPIKHESVPLYNIQISRNPPEDYVYIQKVEPGVKKFSSVLPDWISVLIFLILVIAVYTTIWFKCRCVRDKLVISQ